MCDANKMTDAVKTIINDATDLAEANGNASLEPIHVIFTLFQGEGLGARVCEKVQLVDWLSQNLQLHYTGGSKHRHGRGSPEEDHEQASIAVTSPRDYPRKQAVQGFPQGRR